MRQIKVTYRAVFQQPVGALNPAGFRIPVPVPVEVFQRGQTWQVCEISGHNVFSRLGRFATAASARDAVFAAFETQVRDWQMWGTVPNPDPTVTSSVGVERLLEPSEVCDLGNGKMAFKGPDDYTHILHAQNIPPGAHMPPAACGAQVDAKCFISTKANVEPSCKACAEVWRREYQNR
jgi:hypothetical protein